MSKKVIAVDLETIPNNDLVGLLPEPKPKSNLKDPEKIKEDIQEKRTKQLDEMGLNPLFNRVCCAGIYGEGDAKKVLTLGDENEDGERLLLTELYDIMAYYDVYITFNGRQFDWRVLNLHNIRLGINPGFELCQKKYNSNTSNHIDLRQILSGTDTFAKGNLDLYASVFLGRNKTEGIDGSAVRDFWEIGSKDFIAEYCIEDCEITFELFLACQKAGLIPWI